MAFRFNLPALKTDTNFQTAAGINALQDVGTAVAGVKQRKRAEGVAKATEKKETKAGQQKVLRENIEVFHRIASGVNDQASHTRAKQLLNGMGFDVLNIPDEYDATAQAQWEDDVIFLKKSKEKLSGSALGKLYTDRDNIDPNDKDFKEKYNSFNERIAKETAKKEKKEKKEKEDKTLANLKKEYKSLKDKFRSAKRGVGQFIEDPNKAEVAESYRKEMMRAAQQYVEGGGNPEDLKLTREEYNTMTGADATTLPEGVTEEDLQHTMQLHDMTREAVLEAIGR